MSSKASWSWLLQHPAHFIAYGFGAGLSPVAPGTVGTLVAIPLYLLLAAALSPPLSYAALAALFLLGVWACESSTMSIGVSDPGGVCWDEVVAFMLVLSFVPRHWGWYLAAFIAFRFFDIVKPFPIRYFDRTVKGGFGVMLDDVLAALYAIALIKLAQKGLTTYG